MMNGVHNPESYEKKEGNYSGGRPLGEGVEGGAGGSGPMGFQARAGQMLRMRFSRGNASRSGSSAGSSPSGSRGNTSGGGGSQRHSRAGSVKNSGGGAEGGAITFGGAMPAVPATEGRASHASGAAASATRGDAPAASGSDTTGSGRKGALRPRGPRPDGAGETAYEARRRERRAAAAAARVPEEGEEIISPGATFCHLNWRQWHITLYSAAGVLFLIGLGIAFHQYPKVGARSPPSPVGCCDCCLHGAAWRLHDS